MAFIQCFLLSAVIISYSDVTVKYVKFLIFENWIWGNCLQVYYAIFGEL